MGYKTPLQTWQIKYGINSEPYAEQKCKQFFKNTHQNSEVSNPGMTVVKSHPFISVSPDLEIKCLCYGLGLVKIKCSVTFIGKVPSAENYEHLEVIIEHLYSKKRPILLPNSRVTCSYRQVILWFLCLFI